MSIHLMPSLIFEPVLSTKKARCIVFLIAKFEDTKLGYDFCVNKLNTSSVNL